MAMLRNKGNPYIAGYAIPQNVYDEPLHRGAIVSKYRKRGTIDQVKNPREPGGYILPQSVRDEPLGQGVRVTHYRKRGTISNLIPDEIVTRHKTERVGVGGIFEAEGGIFNSGVKRSGYGSLGQVTKGPTLAVSMGPTSAIVAKAPATVAATPVAPVAADATGFQIMVKGYPAPTLDQLLKLELVFRGVPVPVQKAALQNAELAIDTAKKIYDMAASEVPLVKAISPRDHRSPPVPSYSVAMGKRIMLIAGTLAIIDPELGNAYAGVARVYRAGDMPTNGSDADKYRAAQVHKVALILYKKLQRELADVASGRLPGKPMTASIQQALQKSSEQMQLDGVWGAIKGVADDAWDVVSYVPEKIGEGISWLGKEAWELIKKAGRKIKDAIKWVADKFCKAHCTGIPGMAAEAIATAKAGPQGGQSAAIATQSIRTICGCGPPAETPLTEPPPSEFPLVPVLIGGGVLLGIILLTR